MTDPQFGEIWLAPEGSLLPGGMLCLIVSGEDYNTETDQRIIVEVIGEQLAAGGGLLVDLGTIGSAVIGTPQTVSASWFTGATEPVAVLDPNLAADIANRIRALLGP